MRGLRSIAAAAVVSLLAATLVAAPGGAAELSVTVTPTTDLIDGQVIHVAVTGATPGGFGYANLCSAGSGMTRCSQGGGGFGTVDDQGSTAFDVGLDAEFVLFDRSTVDCRVAPGCVLLTTISSADGTATQTVRSDLAFRPDGPLLPPPTIAVTPSTDLVDGTTVHVTGAGFTPGCRGPARVVQVAVHRVQRLRVAPYLPAGRDRRHAHRRRVPAGDPRHRQWRAGGLPGRGV